MTLNDLLSSLIEKDSFELRILYETSCVRLYTCIASDTVPPELLKEKVKSWTTFWLSNPLDGERPYYVLQIETYHRRNNKRISK